MTSTSVRPSGYNKQSGKDPTTAALLSIIPGLGQLYNGETRKGLLFLTVAAANGIVVLGMCFMSTILASMKAFAEGFHMKPNGMLIRVMDEAHLGSVVSIILLGFFISFVAYAVRDAYDHAAFKRRKIYPDMVIELPEATSGSYICHFAFMASLFILAFFFLIPPPPRAQITDIEFIEPQELVKHRVQAPRKSTQNSVDKGKRNPEKPVTAHSPAPKPPAPQKAAAKTPAPAKQAVKSTPAPKPTPSPAKPSPAPTPRPTPSPSPAPSPSPRPSPSPSPVPRPMAATPAPRPTPSPSPSPRPMAAPNLLAMSHAPTPFTTPAPSAVRSAPGPAPTLAPSPMARSAGAGSLSTPTPLARPAGGSAGLPSAAPSPISGGSRGGAFGAAPMPRVGSSPGGGAFAPAPVAVSGGGGGGGASGAPSIVPVAAAGGGRGGGGGGPTSSGGGGAPAPRKVAYGGGGGGGGGGGPEIIVRPSVPAGGGGGGGNGTGSNGNPSKDGGPGRSTAAQADVDFGPYMADLQRRIKKHWFPPKGNESKRVVVIFKVHSGGELSGLHIDHGSGVAIADNAALKAVEDAAPFRPLPAGAPDIVDIQFTFDYNVFAGQGRGVFRQF